MIPELDALQILRKSGDERLKVNGNASDFSLLGFWQWSCSDLVGNALRGTLAEYIVACALGIDGGTRTEWDAFDLCTADGVRIEVKSAAYLQSWKQSRYSAIGYDVRATFGWDAATNTSSPTRRRHADVYVFCLLHHKDKTTIDPLDLSQWTFYVLPARVLDERIPTQRRLALSTLLRLDPQVCSFEQLKDTVNVVVAS